MKFSTRGLWVAVFFSLAILLCAGSVWAQAGASTIRGTVTDASGGVVPNATVTITNLQTNLTRTQTTTAVGAFGFELIPIGDYKVEVQAQGFKKQVISPVHALVGGVAEVPVSLAVGELTAVVQVEATSTVAAVNTTDATLGNNMVSQQISQLPMEARNIAGLLTLQPGVTGSPNARGYVAGARSDQSNITLDGVDVNDAQSNSLDGVVLRLNSEAIEEFRVNTVNANANQGRSSAAQISLVTKSGTNTFHGALFEYHRNTIFTANDFFSNRAGVPRSKLIRNTYGGAAGGPVKKDKLFFFYSYEGRRDASGTAVTRTVPLAHVGQGQMKVKGRQCVDPINLIGCGATQTVTLTTANLNTMFPAVLINPTAVTALLAATTAYPVNDPLSGDGLNTGGFRFNASTPVDLNSNVAKLDWIMSPSMSLSGRANFIYDLVGQAPQFPDTPAPSRWDHPWGVAVNHNWTLNRSWVNSFRYGLTRAAFSQQGDSAANNISFRFVFSPLLFQRELSRTTPVQNFIDDVSWTHGNHTVNFGTNIRITGNSRLSFGSAFDTAITNPSFYTQAGAVVSNAVSAQLGALTPINVLDSVSEAQNAATALIGRYTQYTARFTFGATGTLLPSGSATDRRFNTKEYDFYAQDSWKIRRDLTITLGLRYGISQPVNESKGFGVVTDIPTATYLQRRIDAGLQGNNYAPPLTLNLAGGNGKGSLYNWDKNNFQPRVAAAWSPRFESKVMRMLFGEGGHQSVLRGGFGITNDYYGQALAVLFDLNNTLGFSSNTTIAANTYNIVTTAQSPILPPAFTGYNQQIRPLPGVIVPGNLTFPRQQPADMRRRIEGGLDTELTAPINYVWNMSFEREFPAGVVVQLNYTGRLGRKLLATRDVMAITNLKNPSTGVDWYTAATQLEVIRQTRPAANTAVTPIPYFETMFPGITAQLDAYYGCGGTCMPLTFTPTQTIFWVMRNFYANDWTSLQDDMDAASGVSRFYNPQYGALSAWGTFAESTYHGLSLSVRQRIRGLLWDFNYTFSHSLDNASGLQDSAAFGGAFLLNPIRPRDGYSSSDFDLRHQINVNGVYEFPFGRGKHFGSSINRGLDAFIGGWQLSGIYRWNTGLPISAPYDDARWATNWNVQSFVTQVTPFSACPTRGNATTAPKVFGCNPTTAYQSFRNAYPGETGQRNVFRLPGYSNVDLGLSKSFTMPWNESHKLQLRWEVFNVLNRQAMGGVDGSRTGYGMASDPKVRNRIPPANWTNFTSIQGTPRVMQIGAKFEF